MSGRVMNYIKLKSGKSWCLQDIGNDQGVILGKETKAFPTALKYKRGSPGAMWMGAKMFICL